MSVGLSNCIRLSIYSSAHLSITTHLNSPSEEAAVLWPLILLNCCSVLPAVNPQVSKPLSQQPQRSVFTASVIKRWCQCSNASALPKVGRNHKEQLLTFFCLSCPITLSFVVSLLSLLWALYLSPPGFNLEFCLPLNSYVISCQARRGSVCAGFGFYTELPMFSTPSPIQSFTIFPHLFLSLPPLNA